jgi:steroid delta-isomerase
VVAFTLTTESARHRMVISPIDVMEFDDQARITSMRAYWSEQDMRTETI